MAQDLAAVGWPVRTERLLIRPATPADADAVHAFRRLEEVSRWLTAGAGTAEDFREHFAAPDRLTQTLVIEEGGVVVGDLYLAVGDAWAQREVADRAVGVEAEIGWVVAPQHRGRGVATEAVRALLDTCFGPLGLRRVTAGCFAHNIRSWQLMERLGMRRESHNVADSLHRDGTWHDGYVYALLTEEWAGPAAPRGPG